MGEVNNSHRNDVRSGFVLFNENAIVIKRKKPYGKSLLTLYPYNELTRCTH